MIKNILQVFIVVTIVNFLFNGCATVLSGYEDRVDLVNAPEDLKVYSKDGVELPISSRTVRQFSEESKKFENKEFKTINLRTNKEHILLLKSNSNHIFPK